ncbi:MAG: 6-phosphogluconolactonase [Gemmatimonadota bacterium]
MFADAAAVARAAAAFIAAQARAAVAERGRFGMALSGGRTPWLMLRELADEDVPWAKVHVFQVDERVAPAGDRERNFTHLQESLLAHVVLPAGHVHPMPVEGADLVAAGASYAAALRESAGSPPVLDLVHLGLGTDGHTASLVPDDPVLDVSERDVAVTRPYQGRPRMTLTFPVLDRARCVLWIVTGAEKAAVLARLRDGDRSLPAARVRRDRARVIADRAAAAEAGLQR